MPYQAAVFADRILALTEKNRERLGAAIITCLPDHPGARLEGETSIRFADGSLISSRPHECGVPSLVITPPNA